MSNVPPYTGQNQRNWIDVVVTVPPSEEGPGLMPPLPSNQERRQEFLPPPLPKTDLWTAQQTWPL